MDYEVTIQSLYNSQEYQNLNEFYNKPTLFSTLGIERNENRHSAFIAWLLNDKAEHGLGCMPMKKFLCMYALQNKSINDSLRISLVTGNYSITNLVVSTENALRNFDSVTVADKMKRLDVTAEFTLTMADGSSTPVTMVLENKIYSGEHQHGGAWQTNIYHQVLQQYCNQYGRELIEVFLSPDECQQPQCNAFCKISYQQLLDAVISPLTYKQMDKHSEMIINDYIRNLSIPTCNVKADSDDKNDELSIMATSSTEREQLIRLTEQSDYLTLFRHSVLAYFEEKAYPLFDDKKEAKQIMDGMSEGQIELLTEFWDANANLLRAVCRNCKMFSKDTSFLFTKSNRSNTRYRVKVDGKYVFPDKPALSQGMTALAIFHAYACKHRDMSVHDMNNAFPCDKINDYYFKNYYSNLFYPSSKELEYDSSNLTHKGKKSQAVWDFYVKPEQLLVLGNGTMKVMCVKMWRKPDFDKLLKHVATNLAAEGIEIEEV